MDEVLEQLEEYFKNSKEEFSIGLQNFQGIREYTTIPLAPLTLVYVQNSAGKSTIHDAIEFIHGFLGGSWNSGTAAKYLDRWANKNRKQGQIEKGFIGDTDDVIISISTYAINSDYDTWESRHYNNQEFVRESPLWQFFDDQGKKFTLYIIFNSRITENGQTEWYVKCFSVYFGDDEFIKVILNEENIVDGEVYPCRIQLNKKHMLYQFFDHFFETGIAKIIESNFELVTNGDWLSILNAELGGNLNWYDPIDWYQHDLDSYNELNYDELKLRDLLKGS